MLVSTCVTDGSDPLDPEAFADRVLGIVPVIVGGGGGSIATAAAEERGE